MENKILIAAITILFSNFYLLSMNSKDTVTFSTMGDLALQYKQGLIQIKADTSQEEYSQFLHNSAYTLAHTTDVMTLFNKANTLCNLKKTTNPYAIYNEKEILLGVPHIFCDKTIKTPHGLITRVTNSRYSYVTTQPEEFALCFSLSRSLIANEHLTPKQSFKKLLRYLPLLQSANKSIKKLVSTVFFRQAIYCSAEISQQYATMVTQYLTALRQQYQYISTYLQNKNGTDFPITIRLLVQSFTSTFMPNPIQHAIHGLCLAGSLEIFDNFAAQYVAPNDDALSIATKTIQTEALYQALISLIKEQQNPTDADFLPKFVSHSKTARPMVRALNKNIQCKNNQKPTTTTTTTATEPESSSTSEDSTSQDSAQAQSTTTTTTTITTHNKTTTTPAVEPITSQQPPTLRYAQRVIDQHKAADIYHGFSWEIDPFVMQYGQLTMRTNPKSGIQEKHYSMPGYMEWMEKGKIVKRFIVIALCMDKNDIIYHRGLVYSPWSSLTQDHLAQYQKDIEYPTLKTSAQILKSSPTHTSTVGMLQNITDNAFSLSFFDKKIKRNISLFKITN